MKTVYIYQIVDVISEGLISSFIGPNDVYANRQFKNFLSDPKLKDNIDPSDFILVCSKPVDIFESYSDYSASDSNDEFVVSFGDVVVNGDAPSSLGDLKEKINEA